MDPRWVHPFTCLIAGPTGSGKTHFMTEFVENAASLMQPAPSKILWLYGQWQDSYLRLKDKVDFRPGLEALDEFSSSSAGPATLVIIDDLMHETDERLCRLFTKGSHHLNLSVMYVVQNLFNNVNKEHRTISLNAQYVVLFKNPRDSRQIEYLANQMYPGRSRLLREAFKDATDTTRRYRHYPLLLSAFRLEANHSRPITDQDGHL